MCVYVQNRRIGLRSKGKEDILWTSALYIAKLMRRDVLEEEWRVTGIKTFVTGGEKELLG